MDQVKANIARGTEPGTAIRGELLATKGLTVKAFAAKHRLPRQSTVEALRGARRPTDKLLRALARELGGSKQAWATLLWEAARPEHMARAS